MGDNRKTLIMPDSQQKVSKNNNGDNCGNKKGIGASQFCPNNPGNNTGK